ncbi:hypothetical protein FDI24_gp035 [Acidovorax phage ACP17]|uniref:Uncharacterized protein n=1 Tax=Acidovorax phage ACP17 TaxID=2010329 RepID=A0A218M3F6_9CAUD|nr:hypothetical protein FDI24_gp035 [Acidovorax phage ACP17]ASD50569.1 hypothetical protein [Acidovorax phage ACP17]
MKNFQVCQTVELSGIRLAYAVALVEGITGRIPQRGRDSLIRLYLLKRHSDHRDCWGKPQAEPVSFDEAEYLFDNDSGGMYHPHMSWGTGGPIVERHRIAWEPAGDGWIAKHGTFENAPYAQQHAVLGRTQLEAAMRLHVRDRFGDTLQLPDYI